MADIDCITQNLIVTSSGQAEVNFQPIEVTEQADVGVYQAVPTRCTDSDVPTQQSPEQQTGNGGLAGIERQDSTADRQ
ncbi:hypothetical protein D3C86_1801660 [compost metagenome]